MTEHSELPAEIHTAKTEAETATFLAEAKKLNRESLWWSSLVSPPGLAVVVTAIGLSTTYFSGWFSAEHSRIEAKRNLLKAETVVLENEKHNLTQERNELETQTRELARLRDKLETTVESLQIDLAMSQETIAATEQLFHSFVRTGAVIGPFNEQFRLDFSQPTGKDSESVTFAPPKTLLSLVRRGGYADVIHSTLIGSVTSLNFVDVPIDAEDMASLQHFENLSSIMLLYSNLDPPNDAIRGLIKLPEKIQTLSIRGTFDANLVAQVVPSLRQCEDIYLEDMAVSPALSDALRSRSQRVRSIGLDKCALPEHLLAARWEFLESLRIFECSLPEDLHGSGAQFPRLKWVWITQDAGAELEGDKLLWLRFAPELDRVDFRRVNVTDELIEALLQRDPMEITYVDLDECHFQSEQGKNKLLSHFGERIRVRP